MRAERVAVIVPAAGKSTRFGGGRNKLSEDLHGQPVLLRTLAAFFNRPDVHEIIVAGGDVLRRELPGKVRFCPGGSCRAESVRNALAHVSPDVEWVAVHDAARPLVSQKLIDRAFAAAFAHGAAVPALPVALTVKEATGPLPAKVRRTLARSQLWAMQTPQVMRRADLLEAFARCPLLLDQVTDDAQLLELTGKDVWLVEGEERNLKITTELDLKLAQLLCS